MTNSQRHIEIINTCRRHGLEPDVEKSLIAFEETKGFKGRDVIELGAMIPREVSSDILKVNSWTYVHSSTRNAYLSTPHLSMDSSLAIQPYQDQHRSHLDWLQELETKKRHSVDAVFSFGTLHEFSDLGYLLDLLFEVLKPGGRINLFTSSIWTAPYGHDTPPVLDKIGRTISADTACLPPWCHLLWSKHHLYRELSKTMDLRTAAAICHEVHESSRINRYMTTDYLTALENSKFDLADTSSSVHLANQSMPADIKTFLSQKYPQESHIDTKALRIELEKSTPLK